MHDETIRKRLLELGIYLCIITLLIFYILTFLIKRALEYGMRNHYESDGDFSLPKVHGIGYYGHYHDQRHKFHIWFGMPLE